MNGQTKYDYPPQPSQATGDFPGVPQKIIVLFLQNIFPICLAGRNFLCNFVCFSQRKTVVD